METLTRLSEDHKEGCKIPSLLVPGPGRTSSGSINNVNIHRPVSGLETPMETKHSAWKYNFLFYEINQNILYSLQARRNYMFSNEIHIAYNSQYAMV